MNKTVHLIGGPGHGKTVNIKAGASIMYPDGSTYNIKEVIANGCSFYIGQHPQATAGQLNEVLAHLRDLSHDARPFNDGRAMHTHPGLGG